MNDTIFAISSGAPPAAIAVLRVSGARARAIAEALAGGAPIARRATVRRLRDGGGETLDRALVLWFPGPHSATGEDVLELHLHGGRAVIAAVEGAVSALGARRAGAGEFTRRALLAGRIDLAQASGLADLLEAETETQRRAALAASEGALTREVAGWLDRLSEVRAGIEAAIDYDEEGDVTCPDPASGLEALVADLGRRLSAPTSERVRDGIRVVIAGPPNAGKSSLFNTLIGRDAAIVAAVAGTTRDRVEARVLRGGGAFTLVDTAGLSEWTDDPIEREGIRRSREAIDTADLLLWLADTPAPGSAGATIWLYGRADAPGRDRPPADRLAVSAHLPTTIDRLWCEIGNVAETLVRTDEPYLLQERQRETLAEAHGALRRALAIGDPLLRAEECRRAAEALALLIGVGATEAMLDALFARFCVGK